jgi:sulfite reductase (NADPH) flavoprotein alpha-component
LFSHLRPARQKGKRAGWPRNYKETDLPRAQFQSRTVRPPSFEGPWIFIASTYGAGEPPDHACGFASELTKLTARPLSKLDYGVLAFADSNYEKFCGFGRFLDERLAKLGGVRLLERNECDSDPEPTFEQWSVSISAALKARLGASPGTSTVTLGAAAAGGASASTQTGAGRPRPAATSPTCLPV